MNSTHTVKAFDLDLEQIRARVAEIGGLTEAAVRGSLEAVVRNDTGAAATIIQQDAKIDQLVQEAELQCVRVIALRAPMADDLREILTAFKVSVLLERMADCARNIAEQMLKLHLGGRQDHLRALQVMLAAVLKMVQTSLDAFVRSDVRLCALVCENDREVGALHERLAEELLADMSRDPTGVAACTGLLLISLKLERIGDHAASIARAVHYSATGQPLGRQPMAEAL